MKTSTKPVLGARHFSEIVATARELTTEYKCKHMRRLAIRRLTNELLIYQMNKSNVSVNIY